MPPCEPWATEADLCPPCDNYDYDGIGDAQLALEWASSILYKLSPVKYPGFCQKTVRPCARTRTPTTEPVWRSEVPGWRRQWGICGCSSDDRCGCSPTPQVFLGSNIVHIDEVRLDGQVVPEDEYRLDERRWLVRMADAEGHNEGWPCCQRLDLEDTEEDTFAIDLTFGRRPPPDGVHAAAVLACQLSLACDPSRSGECRLPKRVTSITRQGITVAVAIDPLDLFENGRTGLAEVDLFLGSERAALRRGGSVLSPDIPSPARRIG